MIGSKRQTSCDKNVQESFHWNLHWFIQHTEYNNGYFFLLLSWRVGCRRNNAFVRVCWCWNHFSISLTRKSEGAMSVWNVKGSPALLGAVEVFASFWHLRIIRSLR